MNRAPNFVFLLALAACASDPAPEPVVPIVGEVELVAASPDEPAWQQLDIGIPVFDLAVDASAGDDLGETVYSEIKANERHLLPYLLRRELIASAQWGAVRVLPRADPSVDLLIDGELLQSNGNRLKLRLSARDSSGRLWLEKVYTDIALEQDYPPVEQLRDEQKSFRLLAVEPFNDLFQQFANDLVLARAELSSGQLRELGQLSLMLFAADLAPESFADNIRRDEDGLLEVVSLPAEDDPMMIRVRDMRTRHHLFIDTVDEYYQALYRDMHQSYLIWRRHSFDQIQEEEKAASRARDRVSAGSSSGFMALRQRYDRFRWSKIYEQEFRELASGFNREAAPAILELNQQVHGLTGTMDEQYIQWRRILRQLFALEVGPPA